MPVGYKLAEVQEEIEKLPTVNIADKKKCKEAIKPKINNYEDSEEQGRLLKLPCKIGDTVFDLVLCDDNQYYIFEMKVCHINPFGGIIKEKVWNVYLEDAYTKAYRSFYDFGKTVFHTESEAITALKLKVEQQIVLLRKEIIDLQYKIKNNDFYDSFDERNIINKISELQNEIDLIRTRMRIEYYILI